MGAVQKSVLLTQNETLRMYSDSGSGSDSGSEKYEIISWAAIMGDASVMVLGQIGAHVENINDY